MGKMGRSIIREAMRYDEHTCVSIPGVKKVDGQFDEVIPIARHKDTVFGRSISQLGVVIESLPMDLVDTNDIKVQTATNFRYGGVDILVQ